MSASGPSSYNQPLSASVHAGRESSGNVTFLGVLQDAVPKNTSYSPLPFGAPFARSTRSVCNWPERQQPSFSMRVFGRPNRRLWWLHCRKRRQPTWRVTRAPAGHARENFVFALSQMWRMRSLLRFWLHPHRKTARETSERPKGASKKIFGNFTYFRDRNC